VLVDRTGREAGLGAAIRDQSPSGEHGLRLRLEAASFDVLITWLASLQQQHGVSVDAATIDAGAAPGLVNASLTLSMAQRRARERPAATAPPAARRPWWLIGSASRPWS